MEDDRDFDLVEEQELLGALIAEADLDDDDLPIETLADCGAHKLNLAASVDVTKYCDKHYPTHISKQNEIIAKLTKLWSLQNMSTFLAEEFKKRFGTIFKVGVDTRWFSKVEAIEDYLQKLAKYPVEMYRVHRKMYRHKEKKQQLEELSIAEVEFLNEYVKVNIFQHFL